MVTRVVLVVVVGVVLVGLHTVVAWLASQTPL
jgi:hypothetical protein